MIFDRTLEIYCPVCGHEFDITYDKDKDSYMTIECPECGEKLVFGVVIRTIITKAARIDTDIMTLDEYEGKHDEL